MRARDDVQGRVLIVDDQLDLLAGVKAMLELNGIEVILHDSMITLPLILRDADPDVVLLDVSLPALSGTGAMRNGLRRILRTDAYLVLFSGRSADELAVLSKEFGADGFVTKSQQPREIVSRIQLWIDRRRLQRATQRNEVLHVATSTASSSSR
jgi:two-component system response regulator PrrA